MQLRMQRFELSVSSRFSGPAFLLRPHAIDDGADLIAARVWLVVANFGLAASSRPARALAMMLFDVEMLATRTDFSALSDCC